MNSLGIILAAGKSTRLYPATLATTKQLLPVYDKPLIYYPLTTLMLAGIRDYVIITSPQEKDNFEKLFGAGLRGILLNAIAQRNSASIFLYPTQNPTAFGIAEMQDGTVISLEEKPKVPKSNLAVTGLYMYPPTVYEHAKKLTPSPRGELEITDLNMEYLRSGELKAHTFLRGTVWFDTGTPESLLETSNFIHNIQKHQNYLVGSPHEVAINNAWVTDAQIQPFIQTCMKTEYGRYLYNMLVRL